MRVRFSDGLFALTTLWVIVQNNSRIAETLGPGDPFILVSVPRQTRVLEAMLVGLVAVLLSVRFKRAGLDRLAGAVIGFLVVAAIGIAAAPGDLSAQLQGVYLYVAPFLVFLWAGSIAISARVVQRALLTLSAWALAGVAVALVVQLPVVAFTKGDWAHGLFSDAHVFGAWLAVASCTAFSFYASRRRVRWLWLACALLLFSYYPANEKMIVFNLGWIAASAARWTARQRLHRTLAFAAPLTLAIIVGLWTMNRVISRGDADPLSLQAMSDRAFSELGPIAAWRSAWAEFDERPTALLFGVGSGNYGGVAAARTLLSDDRVATAATRRMREMLATGEDVAGAFATGTNTWANLFAEFGIFGMALFAFGLLEIVRQAWRWQPEASFEFALKTLFLCLLAAVLFQGLVTPYTNWNEPILTYPMMLIGGFIWSRARQDRASERRPLAYGPAE